MTAGKYEQTKYFVDNVNNSFVDWFLKLDES